MMAQTTSITMQNLLEIARRWSEREDEMWCFSLFTGRICRRQLCRYCFYSRANFWVFRPAGATRWTDPGHKSAPSCLISSWSVQGWGFTATKTGKNWNFTNIIAPKGRVPCTIFTKFTAFMRVISLHNFAKYGCFTSINERIINNLLRWGRFQPNFRRPLAEKLWMGAKRPKMMARTTSITTQNLMEIARRTSA